MVQEQVYTCAVSSQTVTLTAKVGAESKPIHLGNATAVFTTVAAAADAAFWDAKYEYDVVVRRRTKTNP